LAQEEFAARYHIPLGTFARLGARTHGAADQPVRAYLKVIASNPEWVSRALASAPPLRVRRVVRTAPLL